MSCAHEVVHRLEKGKLWCRGCGCLLQEPGGKWSKHNGLRRRKPRAYKRGPKKGVKDARAVKEAG